VNRYVLIAILLAPVFSLFFAYPGGNGAVGTQAVIQQPASHVFEIGEDQLVYSGGADVALVEPYLAINPQDARNMIAVAMVARSDRTYGCLALTSFDGGRTWQKHDFGISNGGDVWVKFLPSGTAVFSVLAGEKSELQLFRSADGGRTWSGKPTTLGGGHDHPTLLVDSTGGQFSGSIYAVSANGRKGTTGKLRSAVFVARSVDGGLNFLEPSYTVANNLSYEAHNPAIMSDGTLLVPFADHHRPGDRRRLERQRDWLLTSADGGKSFSEPLLISESCNGAGGWSSLAVGPQGGPFRDRIYHLCSTDQFAGLEARYSDDRGETWSPKLTLGQPKNLTPYARTPAIEVNKLGIVGVVWYDGRNDRSTIKGALRCQEIFFAASVDGAQTFLPEVKVSSDRSCPGTAQNVETALRFPAGGEYLGMVATPEGEFRILWADNRAGIYQLRMVTVRVVSKSN